jgi:hypothetical protein
MGGSKQLRVHRDKTLPLGGPGSGTVFPGFGDSVVSLTQPNRYVRMARREVGQDVLSRRLIKASLNCSQLEDDNNELQGIDVHIAGRRRFGASAVAHARAPSDVEPEMEPRAVGPATNKASITSRPEMGIAGYNHSEGNLPGGGRSLDIGEKMAQGIQHGGIN